MAKLNFNSNPEESHKIEIVIQVRDRNGNPTGRTKTYCSDDCSKASAWYTKQKPNRKRKKKKEAKK